LGKIRNLPFGEARESTSASEEPSPLLVQTLVRKHASEAWLLLRTTLFLGQFIAVAAGRYSRPIGDWHCGEPMEHAGVNDDGLANFVTWVDPILPGALCTGCSP